MRSAIPCLYTVYRILVFHSRHPNPEPFGVVLESRGIVVERRSVEEKGKGACGKRKQKRKRKEKGGIRAREEGEGKVEEIETLGVKRLRLDASYAPPVVPHLVTTWTPPPGIKFHRLRADTYPPDSSPRLSSTKPICHCTHAPVIL